MIVSGPDADAEIDKVKRVTIEDAGLASFAYLRLGDEDFERLNYALAKRSQPHGVPRTWDDAAIMVRGADAGRDVLLTKAGRPIGVIQCKRLESQIALPAVFREIAKLILFAWINGDLDLSEELIYFLSVARDPAGTVVDYFARNGKIDIDRTDEIKAAAREVRATYVTLKDIGDVQAEDLVLDALSRLRLHLLRPLDLDEWLGRESSVSALFFSLRVVVDNAVVTERLDTMQSALELALSRLDPVTDEDLQILREKIEATPESHRLNLGMAMFFGFPREMFTTRADLESRLGRLAGVLNEINNDYTDWVFELARDKASEIADSAQALNAPLIARQAAIQFLSYVAKECLEVALSGSVVSDILNQLSNAPRLMDDQGRLDRTRQDILAEWMPYLEGDFSKLVGDESDLALKRHIITHVLQGLRDGADLETALDIGIEALKPKLFAAADSLRATCKHKTSVVLTGSGGLDSPASLKRILDTVKGLDALKPSNGLS